MEDALKNFGKQFDFIPTIENEKNLRATDKFIISGMGGSHLAAGLLKRHNPHLDLLIHRDYGLPRVPQYFLENSLIILSSYSGNTEEVLDVGKIALSKNLNLAAMAQGGELLDFAKANNIPFIELPNLGVEPRMAVPLAMISLARLIGDPSLEEKIKTAGGAINFLEGKNEGQRLAKLLENHIPLIYSSTLNMPIAYNWKIKFNETSKIPSFYNVFPEFNHNELSGFDIMPGTKNLSEKFFVILLEDNEDNSRIKKRMDVFEELIKKSGIPLERVELKGVNTLEKIFKSITLAEWVALHLAHKYGVPDAKTPLIAEFKRKMS